jgi:uncharacterized heparinase superfamily protein
MVRLSKLRDRWDFARHLRARQIWTRCARMAQRRVLQRWPALAPGPPAGGVMLAVDPPTASFPPQAACERTGPGQYLFAFLNKARNFTIPFDWHRAELNVGNRLWKLNLHYMEYLSGVDTAAFVELVDDWIRGNPAYHRGYWMDSWNSYTLSIRVVVWMQQLAARRTLPADFVRRCELSLARQLAFLRANLEFDVGGNHLLKNLRALSWAARALQDPEGGACARLVAAILPAQLREQILPDGFHYERSPAYHCQVFADLLDVYAVLPAGALRESLAQRLSAMAAALADTTHPDGFVSLFNDGGLHYAHTPDECLAVYARLTGAARPQRRGISLPDAGYFGFRDGDVYLLADAGDIGPDFLVAHSHADTLSFELSVGSQRLIVDAGVYEYGAGAMRSWGRSTRAHNTVTLDGLDSSAVFGEFRVGRRARAIVETLTQSAGSFRLTASHDGYAHLRGSPRVRRDWHYAGRCLEVRDEVRGGRGQRVESRLLFHPHVDVTACRTGIVARARGVSLELETQFPVEITDATWSPDMGLRLPARQVVMRLGEAPATGSYRLRVTA